MYSATFVFDTKPFGEDFHRLDALIATAAQVVISQVMRTSGDKTMQHPLPSARSTVEA
jgi:hypothetical protein